MTKSIEFETEEIVDPVSFNDQPTPDRFSAEWSEYVLSDLADDEKSDGYPKADGLRRLINKFLGRIIVQRVEVLNMPKFGAPQHDDNTATAVVTLVIREHNTDEMLEFSASADASTLSVQNAPFNHHLTAMAETRAEARAFRKALGLKNIIAEEELSSANSGQPVGKVDLSKDNPLEPILAEQKVWLRKESESLNLNLKKFMEKNLSKTLDSIDKCSRLEARKLGEFLSQYKNGKTIPKSLQGYVEF